MRAGSGVASTQQTNAAAISVAGPTGAAAGDLILVAVESVNGATITPPANFTADTTAIEGTTDGRGRNYFASFDVVGGGPYSFGLDTRVATAISCAVVGADLVTPRQVASSVNSPTASATAWAATSLTPTLDGCCIVCFSGLSPNQATFLGATTTTGTQLVEGGWADHTLWISYLNQVTKAAIALAGTWPISEPKWSIEMAIAPAAAVAALDGWGIVT